MADPKVLVAQLGARKHYQEPLIFHQKRILDSLYTDFYSGHSGVSRLLRHPRVYSYLPSIVKKALERFDPDLDKARIIHFPWLGYRYAQALKQSLPQEASRVFVWANQEFCRLIIQDGLGEANTVYGFNGASLELFEYAKSQGIRCILDQTLAERSQVHKLLLEEERYWSDWSLSPFTVNEADMELLRREQREQDLADRIICGSSFVKDSLIARGVNSDKINVIPIGRQKDNQPLQKRLDYKTPQERGDGLRVLFAGSVGLRKGIPYLLEALRQIEGEIPFICKAVGYPEIKPERAAQYSEVCEFLGLIPRSKMTELYAWADVFVLPSICEGSAMVTYEALSSGLPIITTYNSGSIVRDEKDGFIVPIRDVEGIANKLIEVYKSRLCGDISSDRETYLSQMMKNSEEKLLEIMYNGFDQQRNGINL